MDSTMKRKRSSVQRKPRANSDAIFQNYFGCSSPADNESVKDTVVVCDGLGTDNKLKKLKLKFGGVTHTIHTKLKDNVDDNDARPFDKKRGLGNKLVKVSRTESDLAAENHSRKRTKTGKSINVNHEHVRSSKSKRVTERRALDVVGFSDEDSEDAELHFLEKINASKRAVSRRKDNQGSTTSSDESILEGKKPKRESVDSVVPKKHCTRTNRNCSVDSFKDVLSGPVASIIDISDKKSQLSEEQLIKKAEAARKRKIQSEKAAKEAEDAAIKKILGQDSARKKKEEKMNKRRDELAKEKSSKPFHLATNTIRWTMGPKGTVVTFSDDIGLPSIFQTKPSSYPPPREKCAGPNCTNTFKYRDSKSKLPLCSLGCYKAIHENNSPMAVC